MDGKRIVFDDLVRCVIDDVATAEEFQDLVDMMRDDVALQRRYCDQMRIHALLTCHKGQEWPEEGDGVACATSSVRGLAAGTGGSRFCWWKVAAAILLGGGTVWYAGDVKINTEEYGGRGAQTSDSAVSAVRVVSQNCIKGLDLPGTVPGSVRLASGEVVVRLLSGVELTIMGPGEVEVRDCTQVCLAKGRMLVHVPSWATGFTVRTKDLEIYDLGTVFSVSASETVSEVFVFKGSVQVNETGEGWSGTTLSGTVVGICEAGEGVLAKVGETPMRFAADRADVQKLFEPVKGCAALKNPACSFQVVREIADLWEARTMPNAQLAAKDRSKGDGTSPRHQPRVQFSPASAQGPSERSSTTKAGTATPTACGSQAVGMSAVTNRQASDLYFSAVGGGYTTWDTVGNWRVYQSSGGGFSGRLPGSNDTVRINAATLTAENGNALVIGDGVNAACGSFASGYKDYPGTTCLRLEGGGLTSQTTTVIGMYYPGLAVLESGSLYSGTDFYIGGFGDYASGRGVVTNNGATVTALRLHVGHEADTFGRLVHNGGNLDCRVTETNASLQVGFNGGVGEFEANADFSAYAMGIGDRATAAESFGTGTVTVAEGVLGKVNHVLRVRNGSLFMRGGTILLENTSRSSFNLFVRQDADGQALISGWGCFTGAEKPAARGKGTNEGLTRALNADVIDKPLRMVNNGVIVADGEGVERDLDFNLIAVVNNDLHNGQNGTNGWYAVNKGRVLFPRTDQAFSAATTYCWGDLYSKTAPELVNSVSFSFTAPVNCAIRGGFCAPDRSDIPAGRSDYLRPVGVWCIGAYSDKVLLTRAPIPSVSLTFRYDHTQLQATDRKLRLYRYDGSAWAQVGSGLPGGDNRISTDAPLAPVASGDYNIGWFVLMAAEREGTVLSIF
jgi:hypothetical protein